jgi:hypothetical protein
MDRRAYTEPIDVQQLIEARPYLSQLRSREPGLRERIGNRIYDMALALGLRQSAQGMREGGEFAADFVPGVGAAVGGEEAGRDIGAGDYLSGGLGLAMSMIPGGKALGRAGDVVKSGMSKKAGPAVDDYRGLHRAPGRNADNAPLHEMTKLYPEDVYGPNAAQYYGHSGGNDPVDRESARLIRQFRGKPDAEVTIYRAVPIDVEGTVNPGDWVTLNRKYAHSHGSSQFGPGEYRVIEQKVRAGDLFTDANSIHEFGYDPEVAGQALGGAAKKGIRGYHGSPHDFDRFDSSKIGTGEGAQAYGHGLYIAESEGVAKSYRDQLTPSHPDFGEINGRRIADLNNDVSAESFALRRVSRQIGNGWRPDEAADKAIEDATGRLRSLEFEASRYDVTDPPQEISREIDFLTEELAELRKIKAKGVSYSPPPPGKMYEVNINADPDDFLDWDKPLSEQSEKVRRAFPGVAGHVSGQGLNTQAVIEGSGGQAGAAQKLREKGIPGIKYLDAGSRTAGDGSRNYVVFDDRLIDIVRKWGIPAAISTGLITQEMADQMQAQGEI